MSSNLYWKPISQDNNDLPDELKWAIKKEFSLPYTFTSYDLGFVKGLMVCDVKGAKELFQAVEQHGEVEVYERY